MATIPAVKFRKNLGEFLNRVNLRGETFMIERDGKTIAAVVSIPDFNLIKKGGNQDIKDLFTELRANDINQNLSDKEVDKLVVSEIKKFRQEKRKTTKK